jgi:FAD binding domain
MTSASPFSILQDELQPANSHSHESFSAVQALEAKLRSTVKGEVRFDDASRALYATDASNYRQVPIGLVIPLDVPDVIATIAACREFGAPVLSRGGGTSLAGQCCNVAVVIDFSKYMNTILELDPARREARVQPGIVLDALRLEAVMLEPSCASVFRDELINFFPNDELAIRLSRQTVMLSEILVQNSIDWRPPQLPGRRIVVHGHCHQKALMTMNDEMTLLRSTGAQVDLLDSGCCGMAGPLGFEEDKFDVSQTLAERVLLPAVRAADEDAIVVSNGFSCREQIKQNTPRHAVHLAEVLAGNC